MAVYYIIHVLPTVIINCIRSSSRHTHKNDIKDMFSKAYPIGKDLIR